MEDFEAMAEQLKSQQANQIGEDIAQYLNEEDRSVGIFWTREITQEVADDIKETFDVGVVSWNKNSITVSVDGVNVRVKKESETYEEPEFDSHTETMVSLSSKGREYWDSRIIAK